MGLRLLLRSLSCLRVMLFVVELCFVKLNNAADKVESKAEAPYICNLICLSALVSASRLQRIIYVSRHESGMRRNLRVDLDSSAILIYKG